MASVRAHGLHSTQVNLAANASESGLEVRDDGAEEMGEALETWRRSWKQARGREMVYECSPGQSTRRSVGMCCGVRPMVDPSNEQEALEPLSNDVDRTQAVSREEHGRVS